MIKYEYYVISLYPYTTPVNAEAIEETMNEYGERGWELCGVNEHFAFMMRVKKDNEEYFLERDN